MGRISLTAILAIALSACGDDRASLHQAAKAGDLALVEAYLAEGAHT